jgi:hypothetical protein
MPLLGIGADSKWSSASETKHFALCIQLLQNLSLWTSRYSIDLYGTGEDSLANILDIKDDETMLRFLTYSGMVEAKVFEDEAIKFIKRANTVEQLQDKSNQAIQVMTHGRQRKTYLEVKANEDKEEATAVDQGQTNMRRSQRSPRQRIAEQVSVPLTDAERQDFRAKRTNLLRDDDTLHLLRLSKERANAGFFWVSKAKSEFSRTHTTTNRPLLRITIPPDNDQHDHQAALVTPTPTALSSRQDPTSESEQSKSTARDETDVHQVTWMKRTPRRE